MFFTSFVIALSGALMPGPLLTVTISESPRRGMSAGPFLIFGHGILELALVLALLFGAAPILLKEEVFIGISLAGGCILLWMAYSMIRNLPDLHLQHESKGNANRNLVTAGILLSISNPYWLIWWASIGLGYILYSARFGAAGVAAFFLGHISADFIWYALVSYGVVKGQHFFSVQWYQRLIFGCAVFLAAFSVYFFYCGIDKLG